MATFFRWLVGALLCGGIGARLATGATESAFRLVKDGQAQAVIVIGVDAPKSVRFAAAELQRYVERMSGARLAIASNDAPVSGPKILLGCSRFTAALPLEIPTGFSTNLNEEGFVIRTMSETLILAGNDGGPRCKEDPAAPYSFPTAYKGTLFAVYELLERLGCRWYFPGEFGEVVPLSKTLEAPALNIVAKPAFPVRGFWYGLPAAKRKDEQLREDMEVWMLRQKFLPYGALLPSAGDGSIMQPFKKIKVEKTVDGRKPINLLFGEHPEYFALGKDGTRREGYLCLSNPDVVRIAADYARDYFRRNPDATGFGYAPPDGAPTCECGACRTNNLFFMQKPPADPRVQDIGEGFYRFLNEVASAVAGEFPDKWITTTAYAGRIRPPEGTALCGNISVHIALLGYSEHHRLDFPGWQTQEQLKLYERWGRICRYAVARPYYPPFQFHCHAPQPLVHAHAANVRRLKELGLRGSEWEGRCAFMAEGLNIYVLGRCLWNPDTDLAALLDDYYLQFFGAAAGPVRAFYEAVEQMLTSAPVEFHEEERLPEIYPPAAVVRITDALGDIEALVKNADAATRRRVRFARLVADHFRAYSDMRAAETRLDFALAAQKARAMIAQERELEAMHPALIDGGAEARDQSPTYGEPGANASPHGKLKQYEYKQSLLDGRRGELVAALPVAWEFAVDPGAEGLIAQWYLPGDHGREWKPIDTTRCFEAQGFQDERLHGYDGYAWYRVTFTVPEKFRGRKIVLFIGGLNEQGWFWLNGRLVGAQPFHPYWQRWLYHCEVDLTPAVNFGVENRLVVRVFNEQNFGGIFRRCFVYAPKEE